MFNTNLREEIKNLIDNGIENMEHLGHGSKREVYALNDKYVIKLEEPRYRGFSETILKRLQDDLASNNDSYIVREFESFIKTLELNKSGSTIKNFLDYKNCEQSLVEIKNSNIIKNTELESFSCNVYDAFTFGGYFIIVQERGTPIADNNCTINLSNRYPEARTNEDKVIYEGIEKISDIFKANGIHFQDKHTANFVITSEGVKICDLGFENMSRLEDKKRKYDGVRKGVIKIIGGRGLRHRTKESTWSSF